MNASRCDAAALVGCIRFIVQWNSGGGLFLQNANWSVNAQRSVKDIRHRFSSIQRWGLNRIERWSTDLIQFWAVYNCQGVLQPEKNWKRSEPCLDGVVVLFFLRLPMKRVAPRLKHRWSHNLIQWVRNLTDQKADRRNHFLRYEQSRRMKQTFFLSRRTLALCESVKPSAPLSVYLHWLWEREKSERERENE